MNKLSKKSLIVFLIAAAAVLHIPVGVVAAEGLPTAASSPASEVVSPLTVYLPVINSGGWRTDLHVVNPTDVELKLPDFFGKGVGPVPVVGPHSYVSFSMWGGPGSVAELQIEPGLVASTEVRDPNGIKSRHYNLGPGYGVLTLYDLIPASKEPDWKTFLFIYSKEGTGVKVTDLESPSAEPKLYWLDPGQTIIIETDAKSVEIDNNIQVGPPYKSPLQAFAIMSHQPNGERLTQTVVP